MHIAILLLNVLNIWNINKPLESLSPRDEQDGGTWADEASDGGNLGFLLTASSRLRPGQWWRRRGCYARPWMQWCTTSRLRSPKGSGRGHRCTNKGRDGMPFTRVRYDCARNKNDSSATRGFERFYGCAVFRPHDLYRPRDDGKNANNAVNGAP